MFHLANGWFFKRADEGWVTIIKREAPDPESPVVIALSIAPEGWASIVASVCIEGENADTYQIAENFHRLGSLLGRAEGESDD